MRHHAFIQRVAVHEEFVHVCLHLAVRMVERGIILLIAKRLVHRAAVVELGFAFMEGVRGVARVLEQAAHRVRERAAAERIGNIAVGIGINPGLRSKLGVEGVAVGILRGVELGKVDALALQPRERWRVLLIQHKIVNALELHKDQVFARQQAGHRVVLMRSARGEKFVDRRQLVLRVSIRRDRQPRIPQHELIRPGQREIVGRGGKPLVFIPARLPCVPVQGFGHGRIQLRRSQLGHREAEHQPRARPAARHIRRQGAHTQRTPQDKQQHNQHKPAVNQLTRIAGKIQSLTRKQKVGQEQKPVENAPYAVLHNRIHRPQRINCAIQHAAAAARQQQRQRGKQRAKAQRKQIGRRGIKRVIRAAVGCCAQRQIEQPKRQNGQQKAEQSPALCAAAPVCGAGSDAPGYRRACALHIFHLPLSRI